MECPQELSNLKAVEMYALRTNDQYLMCASTFAPAENQDYLSPLLLGMNEQDKCCSAWGARQSQNKEGQ